MNIIQHSVKDLSAAATLELWEQGVGRHPLDQAILLLRHACPEQPFEALCEWTVGQRDACLLDLRRHIIGDRIEAYAECPGCRTGLEFELSCTTLLASAVTPEMTWTTLEREGRSWQLRRPTSRDLASALTVADPDKARRIVLSRCIRGGAGGAEGICDEADEAVLTKRLGELDPLAEILIDLRCEMCGQQWQTLFDIVTFFWNELHMRSRRLLQEVDLLARTYGWTEEVVLGLSDRRRGLYVEMALS